VKLSYIYQEIIHGYSVTDHETFGKLYFKHTDFHDDVITEQKKAEFYEEAKEQGLFTREQGLAKAKNDGLWSEKKEAEIRDQDVFLKGLRQTQSKMFRRQELDIIKKQIEEAEHKKQDLLNQKEEVIGYTCERFCNEKLNSLYTYLVTYSSPDFSEKPFTHEEYDALNEAQYGDILSAMYEYNDRISVASIRKIALANFFINTFYLADGNPMTYFGKPIIELSNHQTNLFKYGCYYKNMIRELGEKAEDADPEVLQNPDELEDFYQLVKGGEEYSEKILAKSRNAQGNKKIGIVTNNPDDLKHFDANIVSMDSVEADIKSTFKR
jgi:hypothetical protein